MPNEDTLLHELDYAVDTVSRTITLEVEIEIETPFFVQDRLQKILNASSPDTLDLPVTLKISSYGGDVLATFGVIDIIEAAPIKINTLGCGPVFSAAAFVLMAGTGERQMTLNSSLMLHPLHRIAEGNPQKIQAISGYTTLLETRCYEFLNKATGTNKDWAKEIGEQRYFSAKECLEYNFIDSIFNQGTSNDRPRRGKGR